MCRDKPQAGVPAWRVEVSSAMSPYKAQAHPAAGSMSCPRGQDRAGGPAEDRELAWNLATVLSVTSWKIDTGQVTLFHAPLFSSAK